MARKMTRIMVNGMPGKMADIIAKEVKAKEGPSINNLSLFSCSLTGHNMPETHRLGETVGPRVDSMIYLIPPENHSKILSEMKEDNPDLIAIDFVKGKGQADENANKYFKNKTPFIMGSTGADYEMIDRLARETKTPCLAFPNMDQRIVAWMYGIQKMAEDCSGAFEGALFRLAESHQADKDDTSGTFRNMVDYLNRLAGRVAVSVSDIAKIRDPLRQAKLLKVPDEWVGWHAYHFLEVYDGDNNSEELTFKRHGGASYMRGTMKALDFMIDVIQKGGEPKRYTMFDVFNKAA